MYLVHVMRDIREGLLTAESLENINDLPEGLKDYYQRHWRTMHAVDPARFESYHVPVLCTLAAAREPVTMMQLVQWTRRKWPALDPASTLAILQEWREFLNEHPEAGGRPRYRIYHTSFQDFLAEEAGLEMYHDEIAETALAKVPGWRTESTS